MKYLLHLLFFAVSSYAQIDFTTIVCLNDSTGRTVTFLADDTSVVIKNVTYVEHAIGCYNVQLKSGSTMSFKRPPFRRVYVSIEKSEPEKPRKEEKAKDDELEKIDTSKRKERRDK